MPGTFVIIPVHNRRETTRRCLAHLRDQDVHAWAEVIVVDDGSMDGTAEMIAREFPWVRRAAGTGDLWWAGAIHLGMRQAIAAGADCICWLNDDTLPDAGSLRLLATTATEQGMVCGAVCRGLDGRARIYGGGWMREGWPVADEGPLPSDGQVPVDWLHGNLVAIPKAVWRRIGLPEWRWLRHNLSDIEYTFRAHEHGIPVCLLPRAAAVAESNDSLSYRSWADPRTRAWEVLSGLWRPKVWWYGPGLGYFMVRLRGWRAAPAAAGFLAKLIVATVLKSLLPGSWVAWIKACKKAAPAARRTRT